MSERSKTVVVICLCAVFGAYLIAMIVGFIFIK